MYERDGWVCQLCMEPVDRSAPAKSDWAPTLDHIDFYSVTRDNSPSNLRLAHHWCNSVRGDGRTDTTGLFMSKEVP